MAKIDGPKWAFITAITAASLLTWCGWNSWKKDDNVSNPNPNPTEVVNKSPELRIPNELKEVIEVKEWTKLTVDGLVCKDPEWEQTNISIISAPEIWISYNDDNHSLNFDASNIDLSRTTEFSAVIKCSDWENEVKKPIKVKVIDLEDDSPLNFTSINLKNLHISPDGILEWTTDISDEDWIESVKFMIDWQEVNNLGDYRKFKINLSNIGLNDWLHVLEITATWIEKEGSEGHYSWAKSRNVHFKVETLDTTPPTITLNWNSHITLVLWDTYNELGATANDNEDWSLTNEIEIRYFDHNNNEIDSALIWSEVWTYRVVYKVQDSAWNEATITRTVEVVKPSFSLSWPSEWSTHGKYTIKLKTKGIDINDLTFRYRWSYNENGEGQDYEGEIKPWETAMGWILTLDNNWNLIIDTDAFWFGDGTSLHIGDWIEFEVKWWPDWDIKVKRFTVTKK
jgi:hypothetical protein